MMTLPAPCLLRGTLLAGLLVLCGWAIIRARVPNSPDATGQVIYHDKPLYSWFYGSRSDFRSDQQRRAAREAIRALGTNAFPFLLSQMKTPRGNGPLYLKVHRTFPARLRSHLPYPIPAMEIKMAALEYLTLDMRGMSEEQMQELVDAVRRLPNPRLRLKGVWLLSMHHQPDPAFQDLVRKLLIDEHPVIRLEAAIWVAESAIVGDPREPTVFPILVEALESTHVRASWLAFEPFIQDHELRIRIERALVRLEPYLTQDQRDRLRPHMSDSGARTW